MVYHGILKITRTLATKKQALTCSTHRERMIVIPSTLKLQADWQDQLAPYQHADTKKSIMQLINTFFPFLSLWALAYLSLSLSIWLAIPIAVIAAGFLIRLFIIFHDCTHQSFFQTHQANDIVGIITGIFTFFPYDQWKYEHAVHHATSGNLDKRGVGDMWMLTVQEYNQLSPSQQRIYRIYRNPFVMLGIGPLYLFVLKNRRNRKKASRKERINTHVTTFSRLALFVLLSVVFSWQKALLIEGIILYVAAAAGIWLFYVQHQFDQSYFEKNNKWDFFRAALEGSSFYQLPQPLQWITGNIGYHHVHHLGSKVPNYYLQQAHEHTDIFKNVPVITLSASLRFLRFRLWDEDQHRLVSFKEMYAQN